MVIDKKVLDVRERLSKAFDILSFDEPSHTYTLNGRVLPSVSSLLYNFYEPFDTILEAEKYSNRRGFLNKDVLDAWEGENKIAVDKGHRVHLFAEDYANWKYFGIGEKPKVFCKQSLGVVDFWNNFPDYLYPVWLERRMFNEELGYAGTADILALDFRDNSLNILDWKGLPLDTPILTNTGFKTMGSLNIKDKVYDRDGNLVSIKNISEVHYNPCFKMFFDNGESIVADHEHRWEITFLLSKGKEETKIMTTEEIANLLSNPKLKHSKYKPKIKNAKPLNNKKIDIGIDPYVLGLWLADGSKSCGIITKPIKEVWEEIKRRGYNISDNLNKEDRCEMRTVYALRTQLRKLNLLYNKHLPDIILQSSYEQRLDCLRGLMDGDGYFNKTRKRFILTTSNKEQITTAVKLISSLGWKPTVLYKKARCNGKFFDSWDIGFNTDGTNPFLVRNQEITIKPTTSSYYRNIIKIEKTEVIPTKCIEVDSPSHTYLYGHSLIVTHNTNKKILDDEEYPEDFLYHLSPDHGLRQSNFGKYSLQFSFYQILLELAGFKVKGRVLIWLDEDKKAKKLYKTFQTKNVTSDLLTLFKQKII